MMKAKVEKGLSLLFILFLTFSLFGCDKFDKENIEVANDEIALKIKLDIKEDIGLLLVDYEVDDVKGSGGTSNADKSYLKSGETLIYTINKQELANLTNIENMKIQFSIITEYIEPNYENIYPPECTKIMEPIYFKGNYGKSYNITISGDKINGYSALLE